MNPKLTPQQQRELLELRLTRLRLEITAEHLRHRQQRSQQQHDNQQWLTLLAVLDALPSRHVVSRVAALPILGKHRLWLGLGYWLWQQWTKRSTR